MMRSFINRRVAIAIVALSLLPASGISVFSQANKQLSLKQLLQLPGKLVGEAKSARSNSDLRLTGYRVEEVSLPQNQNVEIRGQQIAVNKAWRVTVHGGPFPVRALPAVIWIDDEIVGVLPGTTVSALVRTLGERDAELARVLSRCSYLCDGIAVRDLGSTLSDDQTVDILPPFAGG